MDDVDWKHETEVAPLPKQRKEMKKAQRAELGKLRGIQKMRWQAESAERSARLNTGLRGLWQSLSGLLRSEKAE
uniref:hypothetical protein n=1 Tax=Pararhizobium sp. IMCC3301 TaxID=3067904 RepID=UPI002740DD70|nr:hypothetical protein [Pararhizobium sp. IMCC3301]